MNNKKTRIKQITIGRSRISYFYPQYLGWFKKWRNFKRYNSSYMAEIDVYFSLLEDAREFLKEVNYKPVVKVSIHDEK